MTTLTSSKSSPSSLPAGSRSGLDTAQFRQRAMLVGPLLPTLLKLALPTVVVLVVQTLVGVTETWFVSFLGTEAIAGVSLVFPILMLMLMMSNGGIGGRG
jgi:Na+-driven multidrug efflux pump